MKINNFPKKLKIKVVIDKILKQIEMKDGGIIDQKGSKYK